MTDSDKITAIIDMIQDTQDKLALIQGALVSLVSGSGAQPAEHRLQVPWASQMGAQASYAPGDCGAACVAMLVNWRGGSVTVDDIGKAIGKPPGYGSLTFNELIAAGTKFYLALQYSTLSLADIRAEIDAGRPVIVLVNYRSIPLYDRFSSSYNAGHYLLVVGYCDDCMIYHDPYWPQHDKGAYKQMTNADFLKAYTTVAPGNQHAPHALRIAA